MAESFSRVPRPSWAVLASAASSAPTPGQDNGFARWANEEARQVQQRSSHSMDGGRRSRECSWELL